MTDHAPWCILRLHLERGKPVLQVGDVVWMDNQFDVVLGIHYRGFSYQQGIVTRETQVVLEHFGLWAWEPGLAVPRAIDIPESA